jgi:hypothetical protein
LIPLVKVTSMGVLVTLLMRCWIDSMTVGFVINITYNGISSVHDA